MLVLIKGKGMKKLHHIVSSVLFSIYFLTPFTGYAASYALPNPNQSVIGDVKQAEITPNDTTTIIGQRYDVGYNALQNANPQQDFNRPIDKKATIQIVNAHLLPEMPRDGIIVNLPEMRMYYFPKRSNVVYTFPIGIGKIGKTIPITLTEVTRKKENPSWIAPPDIREFDLQTQGLVVPQVLPPGPDNPLGPYAIYMKLPTFLMHSTIFPESIGKRASFGCIRMYQPDVKSLFDSVDKGVPVAIIDEPVKLGWQEDSLYLEAHPPLEETNNPSANLPGMVKHIVDVTSNKPVLIDWQLLSYLAKENDGIPHQIGVKLTPSTAK